METKKNIKEFLIGILILVGVLWLGVTQLASNMLIFRMLMGISLGYVLARAYTGFAGSVNRAYLTGSTKLMRAMTMMFFVTAVGVAGFLMFNKDAKTGETITAYSLWINPINLGLLLGGLMFGFGMSLSTCCASGVMTDLASDFPKALVTVIFFAIGVFVGFPVQQTASWVSVSWFHSASYENGVFFPDLFKNTPLSGYPAALLLTGLLCALVIWLAYRYERYRKAKGTYAPVLSEETALKKAGEEPSEDLKQFRDFYWQKLFVNPWTLKTGALLLAILFLTMFAATKSGWGASTPYGMWFAKLLSLFGVSNESLAAFTHMKAEQFATPFFANGVTVQDLGIFVGALVYLLTSGQMARTAKNFFSYPKWQYLLFVLGGFMMGFGTRLSNGCNVGALYSPIAEFSLSGWIFFIVLVSGAIIGNIFQKRIFASVGKH